MKKSSFLNSMFLVLGCFVGLMSCEHEIDFDYPKSETMVVFDGQISNEGVFVRISRTRPIGDNQKGQPINTAQVFIISDDGKEEQLYYDDEKGCYLSASGLVGVPGHSYQMKAVVDDRRFEATSTMQSPAGIDTVYFRWVKILQQRIYFYCVKGTDPYPEERTYYLCRLMRGEELFRWNPRSGRSAVNGYFEYDIPCSTEKEMDEGKDERGKIPLMEGDTISMELMTIDRPCWDYFQSLMVSEGMMSNPITNIKGGAVGIFMAASITRPDAIVFRKEDAAREQ